MMTKSFFSFGFLSVASLAIGAVTPACGGPVSLDDRPCPCADSWICCAERNVCVAPGAMCPAPATDGGGPGNVADATVGIDAGADPIVLANAQSARCLAMDGEHVYWQNANGLVVGAPKGGGAIESSHFQTPLANNPRCG